MQVIVLMYAVLSVIGVFLGVILVAFVDPRIKLTEGELKWKLKQMKPSGRRLH